MNIKIKAHGHNEDLERKINHIKESWNLNKTLEKDFLQFIKELQEGKVNKGVQVSKRTAVKYTSVLRTFLQYFNKPLGRITKKDLEDFDKKLSTDKILKINGEPFSYTVKVDLRISIKCLLSWKLGKGKAEELTDFFDTREKKKTPNYLKEQEIKMLLSYAKTPKERFLIAVLFDSGARIEEFLNIRNEDVELPEGNDNFVKLTLKEEYSKTEGRVISLYWNDTLEIVKLFLKQRISEGIKSNEALYQDNYDNVRAFLRRLGQRAIKKNITPHLFRHSSATYFASQMNRQQLCYRYGWAFSSKMPDVYISRAGMNNKELDEKFTGTEIETIRQELESQKVKSSKEIEALKQQQEEMMKMIVEYANEQKLKHEYAVIDGQVGKRKRDT